MKPCIVGCSSTNLNTKEAEAFTTLQPAGFILLGRNISTIDETKKLVNELVGCVDHQPVILVDQEGGRVQRLRPPHWRSLPSAAQIGSLFEQNKNAAIEAISAWAQEISHQFAGIGANCCAAPVADLALSHAHKVIGDRAFSSDPHTVTTLAREVIKQLQLRGIIPVIKHIPGHGRSIVDSHKNPGTITEPLDTLEASDFAPFKLLADTPVAMTAHLVFQAIDPELPITLSPRAIHWIRNELKFHGLLLSDCLHMEALPGTIASRIEKSLSAGIDVVIDCHSHPDDLVNNYKNAAFTPEAQQKFLGLVDNLPPTNCDYDSQLAKKLDQFAALYEQDPTSNAI